MPDNTVLPWYYLPKYNDSLLRLGSYQDLKGLMLVGAYLTLC